MSTPNTRFRRLAQLMATWRAVAGFPAPSSACGLLPLPRPAGVTAARNLLCGANTPWYRVRCIRGGTDPRFNGAFTGIETDENGALMYTALFGLVRFDVAAMQPGVSPEVHGARACESD